MSTRQGPPARPALLFLLALGLLSAGCADPDGGSVLDPDEISFGHVGDPGSLFALSAEEFARRANERLGGRPVVHVYGSSQRGGDEQLLQRVAAGTVDIALPSSIMSARIPAYALFEMPYLVQDRAHMGRIEEEIFWPELAPLAGDIGLEVLAVWENGFRHVTNNARPIVSPEDMDGLKIRTPRSPWRVKLFQALGANPTPMPLTEVFLALQTGVMDGQENPLAQIHASRFHEIQRYLSLTGHVYTPAYVVMSSERLARMPERVRQALREEALATQAFVYAEARRLEDDLLADLLLGGIEARSPDRRAFQEASRRIYEEFAESVAEGAELAQRARELESG